MSENNNSDDKAEESENHSKDDFLSEKEISDRVAEAEANESSYQVKQAVQFTGLEKYSAENLDLEPIEEEEVLECLNCAAPLEGPYCHNCGQPDRHFIRFFPKVLWEMVNEAFDLDSRISRTLVPLLLSPGRLSMEYIAGRRARYVNPLRLYIILSVVFFISISLFTNTPDNLSVSDSDGVQFRIRSDGDVEFVDSVDKKTAALEELKKEQAEGAPISDEIIAKAESAITELEENDIKKDNKELIGSDGKFNIDLDNGKKWDVETNPFMFNDWFSKEFTHDLNLYLWDMGLKLNKAIEDDPSELFDEFLNAIPQLMFILLPMFALLLKMTYIFKKRYYMEHLIVALHSHCFIFFSLILIIISSSIEDTISEPGWLKETLNYLSVGLAIWIPINIFITQKRIYAQGYIMTFLKFVFVGWAYWVLLSVTALLAFAVGLATL